jgi:hypothetical protein
VVAYKANLSAYIQSLSEQFVDLGQVPEALRHYDRVVQIRRELQSTDQGSRESALRLAEVLLRVGEIQRHAGHSDAAEKSCAEARRTLEPLASAPPGDAELQGLLGAILTAEAVSAADLHGAGPALARLQQAVGILKPLGSSPGANGQQRERLAEALWELTRLLRAVRPAEADQLDTERSALWEGRPPEELAELALQQTTRALLIGYGKTPISPAAQSVRDLDLSQAAANLRLAIDRGFKDLQRLRAHPDSTALLARAEIQPALKSLERPDQPAQIQPHKPQ